MEFYNVLRHKNVHVSANERIYVQEKGKGIRDAIISTEPFLPSGMPSTIIVQHCIM